MRRHSSSGWAINADAAGPAGPAAGETARPEAAARRVDRPGADRQARARPLLAPGLAEQQAEFVRLFKELVMQTMAERMSWYNGQTFEITGGKPIDERDTMVSSRIIRPSGKPPIMVDWRVREAKGAFLDRHPGRGRQPRRDAALRGRRRDQPARHRRPARRHAHAPGQARCTSRDLGEELKPGNRRPKDTLRPTDDEGLANEIGPCSCRRCRSFPVLNSVH